MGRVRPSPGWLGRVRPNLFYFRKNKEKFKKYLFGILQVSRVFFVILVNIKQYFYVAKNIKSDIKIPDFHQNFQNTKKLVLKKKNIFVHTAKCLKAKKSYCVFHTKKKQCFSMHFGFDNQFIRVKRTLANISKTTKILFCLSFSIRGTISHVIHILDIKCFSNDRTVRFYPIKDKNLLIEEGFS